MSSKVMRRLAGVVFLACIVAVALLGAVFALITWFFWPDLRGSLPAFIVAISMIAAGTLLTLLFDLHPGIVRRCQISKVSLKWFIIAPLAVMPFFIAALAFISFASFEFTFDTQDPAQRNMIVYLVVSALAAPVALLVYFGVKTARSARIVPAKSVSLAAVAIAFIIMSTGGIVLANSYLFMGTIQGGTGFNDGPWLAWHADPTNSISISWLTARPNSSTVHYGVDPGNLNQTWSRSSRVHLHKAFIDGLEPDTRYYYRIPEAFDTPHASDFFSFKTAPVANRNYTFGVFGDMQPTSIESDVMRTNAMVIDGLISRDHDFVLQIGDIASTGTNVDHWHYSMTSFARLAANTPVMAAIGNHDWAGMAGSVNWGLLFSYPYAGLSLGKYYSFDYLDAHFLVLDNFEQQYAMSQTQLEWIEHDILAARARGRQWIFVTFHLSIMTTATSGMQMSLQRNLLPLFDRLAVDAVFFGHDHHYEHYNYTYGHDGLLFEPHHDWGHHAVHYICSGTGGANLEVGYGVLEPGMHRVNTVRWWNVSAGAYQDVQYERRPWNVSRVVENAGFPENYTQVGHDRLYYYHFPEHEVYYDRAPQVGFIYGEQAHHFIEVSIDPVAKTCTITAMYPNGEMLAGPGGVAPQTWVLSKT